MGILNSNYQQRTTSRLEDNMEEFPEAVTCIWVRELQTPDLNAPATFQHDLLQAELTLQVIVGDAYLKMRHLIYTDDWFRTEIICFWKLA